MRREDAQTWNTALVLFVMLLTVGTLGPHTFHRATALRAPERMSSDTWSRSRPAAPSSGVATPGARRARAVMPTEAGAALVRGTAAPREALMLLLLIGQGARAGIGLAR